MASTRVAPEIIADNRLTTRRVEAINKEINKLFKVATYLLKNPQSSKPAELKKQLVDFDKACDEMLYTLDANQELLYRSMSDLNQEYSQHSVCQETLKSINSILSPGFQS
eukprot:jgi/Bigna1/144350/aug1.86_g19058